MQKTLFLSRFTLLNIATSALLFFFAVSVQADEIIERVEFDGETITITENEDFEKIVTLGDRELGRNFFAGFDRVTEVGGVPVALFYLGDGGNACGPSTLIIWRDDEGAIRSLNYEEGCSTPAPAISDNGILFVPFLNPGETRPLKRWSAYEGIRTMGTMSYSPEPGSLWSDLVSKPAVHPLDFFANEAVYDKATALLGDDLEYYARGLRVASEPKTLQSGMIMASGCVPHNCGGADSFIAVNPATQGLFMAQQDAGDYKYWPALESWPADALEAFRIYKSSR